MNIQPASSSLPPVTAPLAKEAKPVVQPSPVSPQKKAVEAPAERSEPPSRKSVEDAVERVSKFVSQTANDISFSVDLDSGVDVVKIIDRGTREVIRQIPSEEMIALAQALDKLQGLFVRDKA
jgi:flagellar protein FlaG